MAVELDRSTQIHNMICAVVRLEESDLAVSQPHLAFCQAYASLSAYVVPMYRPAVPPYVRVLLRVSWYVCNVLQQCSSSRTLHLDGLCYCDTSHAAGITKQGIAALSACVHPDLQSDDV